MDETLENLTGVGAMAAMNPQIAEWQAKAHLNKVAESELELETGKYRIEEWDDEPEGTFSLPELLQFHRDTCATTRKIMEEKNHDYTSASIDPFANFRASSVIGIHPVSGLLVRTLDKLKRIQSFVEQGHLQVKGETVDDAFDDIINYAILGKAMIVEERRLAEKT